MKRQPVSLLAVVGVAMALAFPLRGKLPAGVEGANDPLPTGAVARLGMLRFPNVGRVLSVAYAPDGKTLTGGCWDGSIRIWEVATGRELRQLAGHKGWVKAIALSPDGKILASAGKESEVRLWDFATGRELGRLVGHQRSVFAVAFVADGRTVITKGDDLTLRLWEAATGRELRHFGKWQDLSRKPVQVSPDGKILVTVERERKLQWEEKLRLWDLATDKELGRLEENLSFWAQIAFSPDSKTLAIVHNFPIYLWQIGASKEPRRLEIPADDADVPTCLVFSPDGRTLASGGGTSSIRVWELLTGQERCRFVRPDTGDLCLAFSPDGRVLASGSTDLSVLLWDLTGRMQDGRLLALDLSAAELQTLWGALADGNAVKAHKALWKLVAGAMQSVPFFQKHLQLARLADSQWTAQLVGDLESSQLVVRAKAVEELEKLREAAEPALRKALQDKPTLEVRRRVEALLEKLLEPSPLLRRELRAVEVLERIGSVEARRLLETLAAGASEARLTREAHSSLQRLAPRPAGMP